MQVGVLPEAPVSILDFDFGLICNFGWLAEQQCPGPENRVRFTPAWVQFLHHPPIKTQQKENYEASYPLPKPVAL